MTVDARLRLAYVGMNPARRAVLQQRLGSVDAVLKAVERGAIEVPPRARAAARVPADRRWEELRRQGLDVLLRGEGQYPKWLAELPDAPDLLFCRGRPLLSPGVALVGTRRATRYGLDVGRSFGRAAAGAGWPVVSGLARGVDGAAHEGVLDAEGVGVAVLGCGPDVAYPKEHERLRDRLLATGGCVLSEYPPGTPPVGWRFPPRNRIISGLSGAVVIIEARVDGGALITARRALEQGRDVFAVPGDVHRATSEGCNLLIRDGAHPVLGPDDMVEAVARTLGPPPKRGRSPQQPGSILLASLGSVARHPDDLAREIGWTAAEVLAEVARLEARGRVSFEGGLVMVR